MSGRHSGRTGHGARISALPKTLRLVSRLAPRQLYDELALAKVEIKRKGIQLGTAAAFFAVALVFFSLLVIGLVVAAIMGLATIMPAWLAALVVCGGFLLVALIGALIGFRKVKNAMPLIPQDAIRGLKHDLGIAKEGSAFNPAVLDPASAQAQAEKAAKSAAAAKAKAEKAAKVAEKTTEPPAPSEAELRRRLEQRRRHLTGVRDDLGSVLDVKVQAQAFFGEAQTRFKAGTARVGDKLGSLGHSAPDFLSKDNSTPGRQDARWKPLIALAASTAVLLVLLRKLFKS